MWRLFPYLTPLLVWFSAKVLPYREPNVSPCFFLFGVALLNWLLKTYVAISTHLLLLHVRHSASVA